MNRDEQRGWAIIVVVLLAAILLSGCATTPRPATVPPVRVEEVKVAVPVRCPAIEVLGAEPAYPDSDDALKAAPSLFERVKLLLQGRLLRTARLGEYAAARASC